MKSLGIRRTSHKDPVAASYGPQTLPALSKPVSAIVPPKKVIRALSSHRAGAPQELSFSKGDFFYVIRDVVHTNGSEWYEAHNPVTGARGLVPRKMFEGFDKANSVQRATTTAGPGARISTPMTAPLPGRQSRAPTSPKPTAVFYAVVLHDFQAERTDELEARSGDAISVVAHSNREWFVAKPIGRLGGPGLIPASFLEVRDPLTGQAIEDIDGLIDRGDLPAVEEWKKATMSYKASSISLGVLDVPDAPVPGSKFQAMALTSPGAEQRFTYNPTSPPYQGDQYQQPEYTESAPLDLPLPDLSRLELADPLPFGTLVRAGVSSFHQENHEWLFRVDATFVPDPPAKKNPFDPTPNMSRELTLFRAYDDFYVFQVQLLTSFPTEAGRDPERPDEPVDEEDPLVRTRILPYMPGPQEEVDESITEARRQELDMYLKELVALREIEAVRPSAEKILRCELIRKFFAAREGDIENEVPLAEADDYADDQNGRGQYYDQQNEPPYQQSQRQPSNYNYSYENPSRTMSNFSGGRSTAIADASQYSAKEPNYPYSRIQQQPMRDSTGSGDGGYGRASTASADRQWQDDGRYASSHPYAREPSDGSGGAYGRSSDVVSPTRYDPSTYGSPQRRNASPQHSPYGQNQRPGPAGDRHSEHRGHATAPSSSTVTIPSLHGNPNSPRISSTNPNAAFVKIKIFHSSTEELIAIRVSPRVSLRQLMERVRERLGDDVANIKYRDGMASGSGGTGHFVDILDDAELRGWMSSGDKLVLYAE